MASDAALEKIPPDLIFDFCSSPRAMHIICLCMAQGRSLDQLRIIAHTMLSDVWNLSASLTKHHATKILGFKLDSECCHVITHVHF